MKVRNLLINGLMVALTCLCISGCMERKENSEVKAFNKDLFDVQYSFDKAVIDLKNDVIVVDVKKWTDYEDGEQIQIIAQDGTVYLTSSYNCTLIKTKE